MVDKIQFVKDAADFTSYLNSNQLFISYFTASWCGPCQAIKPKVEELYSKYTNVEVAKVDLDSNQQLAQQYGITAVPTLIFFHKQKQDGQVRGANLGEIQSKFDSLSKLEPNATRNGNGTGGASSGALKKTGIYKEVGGFLPGSDYEILNGAVDFSGYEALNILPFKKSKGDSKVLVKLVDDGKEVQDSTVLTDADSQGIIYLPFLNTVKVYSLLVKLKPGNKLEFSGDSEVDEDEADELQFPKTLKIWKNLTSVISFDDANSNNNYDHVEEIDGSKISSEGNWYEIKLKFVKFQNTKSLSIFIDGDDEDNHTIIEKLIIVGISGEARAQQTLSQEEHSH
ncbi:hypothetical protein DASC09_016690 [Saccharomycopsis crataegensis]|uniref:Thioredoxin n=1 Tax=Saccharomycopsis crataegensis TaxID=43959 RepID=A0AAV5QHY5_9ASCO|nr:hypothetical protein DASC09_016690 [Saccharomycopsis crataegensis]